MTTPARSISSFFGRFEDRLLGALLDGRGWSSMGQSWAPSGEMTASVWDALWESLWPFGESPSPPGNHEFFVEKVVGGDAIFATEESDLCRECGVTRREVWVDGERCRLAGKLTMTNEECRAAVIKRARVVTGDWMLDPWYEDLAQKLHRKRA